MFAFSQIHATHGRLLSLSALEHRTCRALCIGRKGQRLMCGTLPGRQASSHHAQRTELCLTRRHTHGQGNAGQAMPGNQRLIHTQLAEL
eukprot:366474-Chlamydomonas_euryale.AAC.37